MAHTTLTDNCTFIHNGDFIGEVTIIKTHDCEEQITIEVDDIKQFIAEYIRYELINKIEQLSFDELLRGLS